MNERKLASVPKDIAVLNFEQALDALKQLVTRLESADIGLDESIAAYERGAHLRNHCAAKLKEAQAKIDIITLGQDGQPTGKKPFAD